MVKSSPFSTFVDSQKQCCIKFNTVKVCALYLFISVSDCDVKLTSLALHVAFKTTPQLPTSDIIASMLQDLRKGKNILL